MKREASDSLPVEKVDSEARLSADEPYPLKLIQDLSIDMGVTDLAENHDHYIQQQRNRRKN